MSLDDTWNKFHSIVLNHPQSNRRERRERQRGKQKQAASVSPVSGWLESTDRRCGEWVNWTRSISAERTWWFPLPTPVLCLSSDRDATVRSDGHCEHRHRTSWWSLPRVMAMCWCSVRDEWWLIYPGSSMTCAEGWWTKLNDYCHWCYSHDFRCPSHSADCSLDEGNWVKWCDRRSDWTVVLWSHLNESEFEERSRDDGEVEAKCSVIICILVGRWIIHDQSEKAVHPKEFLFAETVEHRFHSFDCFLNSWCNSASNTSHHKMSRCRENKTS